MFARSSVATGMPPASDENGTWIVGAAAVAARAAPPPLRRRPDRSRWPASQDASRQLELAK